MIIEVAEVMVQPGQVAEFVRRIEGLRESILNGGCRSLLVGHGIETPGKVIFIAQWDAVESHMAFRQSPAGATFASVLGPYLTAQPSVEHFNPSY